MILGDGEFQLHHVGLACRSLEMEQQVFAALGYQAAGTVFTDTGLGVRGLFLSDGRGQAMLELLVPLNEQSPVHPWLERGVKMYHLAYETHDLASGIETLRARRGKVVIPATPAVAFDNRPVAFLMLPNLMLVELIQAKETLHHARS